MVAILEFVAVIRSLVEVVEVVVSVPITVLIAVVEAGGPCYQVLHSLPLPGHHSHHQQRCQAPHSQHFTWTTRLFISLFKHQNHNECNDATCLDMINTHYINCR